MVVWIIGLSGSGKTTIVDEVYNKVLMKNNNVVKIDGDIIREVFDNDLGHTIEHRRRNAFRISRLCRFLEDQGIIVLCSILSAFEWDREWNRKNLKKYKEVYIKTPKDILVERDTKGLYKSYIKGDITDVVGFDIEFEEPKSPDLLINNTDSKEEFLLNVPRILELMR